MPVCKNVRMCAIFLVIVCNNMYLSSCELFAFGSVYLVISTLTDTWILLPKVSGSTDRLFLLIKFLITSLMLFFQPAFCRFDHIILCFVVRLYLLIACITPTFIVIGKLLSLRDCINATTKELLTNIFLCLFLFF